MQNIIIFGAGKKGRMLNRILKKKFSYVGDLEVAYFCDNYKMSGSYIDGIKVIHPCEIRTMKKRYDIYISTDAFLDKIMNQLYELNIENDVWYIPDYVYNFQWNKELPFRIKMDISKPRIPYLECGIVKHCNLNCKGCTALSNISQEEFSDINEFEKDLLALKKLFSGIKYFKLFGGEPLLHPMLKEFIRISRHYFPDAELVIHSNGILVPKIDEETLRTMSSLNTKFVFTLYPVTGILKRDIEQRLHRLDVSYEFGKPVYEFRKVFNMRGDYNADEIYKNCCKCINLINGTLSCGMGYMVDGLEKKYAINMCENKFQNCINIYTTNLNGWEINEALDAPSDLCSYCTFMNFQMLGDAGFYPWKCGNPKLEDWIMQ